MWRKIVAWVCVLLITACQVKPSLGLEAANIPWKYADLRLFNPVENITPSQEIIAVYTRLVGENAQIRLDYLDYPVEIDHEILIYVDINPGSAKNPYVQELNWDYRISIPAGGGSQVENNIDYPKVTGAKLRVQRDPALEQVVVTFRAAALSPIMGSARLWIDIKPVDPTQPSTGLTPFIWQGTPPEQTKVIVAFWNTFQAATPAQALKNWDGAHSGPDSSRHGLRYLLDAVESTRSPVILLDLKHPTWLAALDTTGGLPRIRSMQKDGLLILPDVLPLDRTMVTDRDIPTPVITTAMDYSLQNNMDFGLPPSPILYIPFPWLASNERYRIVLTSEDITRNGAGMACFGLREVEQDGANVYAQSSDGLTLVEKNGFTNAAISFLTKLSDQCAGFPLLIKDDFSASYWGNSTAALRALAFLANHPWIQVLDGNHFSHSSPAAVYVSQAEYVSPGKTHYLDELFIRLYEIKQEKLREAAWNMVYSLFTPANQGLMDLRLNYLGQVGHLIAASRWADQPRPLHDCTQDLDWDEQPECQLASEDFFAVIEPDYASITFAFIRVKNEIVQVIAPTYQYSTGLSDPSEWDPAMGLKADPGQLLAFYEKQSGEQEYIVQSGFGKISFSSDGIPVKTFHLVPGGLEITMNGTGFLTTVVPVVLTQPDQRSSDWALFSSSIVSQNGNTVSWSPEPGLTLSIGTDAQSSFAPFYASLSLLAQPEDPNLEYPPGHYTLYPMAYYRIESQGPYQVEIHWRQPKVDPGPIP